MNRSVRIATATSLAVLAAAFTGAARADDPSAYTDPSPHPVQDEQAAKLVNDALAERDVRVRVRPEVVRGGVILTPKPASHGSTTGHVRPVKDPARPTVGVRPAALTPLTVVALAPTRRAGLTRPGDPATPNTFVWLLVAALAAAMAGAVAVARR